MSRLMMYVLFHKGRTYRLALDDGTSPHSFVEARRRLIWYQGIWEYVSGPDRSVIGC